MKEVRNSVNSIIMNSFQKTGNILNNVQKIIELYLLTEEPLEEIETQKAIFYLQQKDAEEIAGGESDV